jgi:hypothetical protein
MNTPGTPGVLRVVAELTQPQGSLPSGETLRVLEVGIRRTCRCTGRLRAAVEKQGAPIRDTLPCWVEHLPIRLRPPASHEQHDVGKLPGISISNPPACCALQKYLADGKCVDLVYRAVINRSCAEPQRWAAAHAQLPGPAELAVHPVWRPVQELTSPGMRSLHRTAARPSSSRRWTCSSCTCPGGRSCRNVAPPHRRPRSLTTLHGGRSEQHDAAALPVQAPPLRGRPAGAGGLLPAGLHQCGGALCR